MKKHYFEHDYSARNDQKILRLRARHGWEGYGLYWALVETMAEDSLGRIDRGAIEGLSVGYGVAMEELNTIIEDCLEIGLFCKSDDGALYSRRMNEHKIQMTMFTEKGRNGAKKRWSGREAISPPNAGGNAIRGEESKLKEKKDNTDAPSSLPPSPRFEPPDIYAVIDYCPERKNDVDPQKWLDFYSAKGWMIGRNKMKDWKAAVRTWEKKSVDRGNKPKPEPTYEDIVRGYSA